MEKSQGLEIDVWEIARLLLRRWWIIILAAIVGCAGYYTYAKKTKAPVYESEVLMYVNTSNVSIGGTSFSISSSDISLARSLVNTYEVILKTRKTLNDVIKDLDLGYSYEAVKGMVTTGAVNKTEVFSIKVRSGDPEEARDIANAIAKVLPDKISEIIDGTSARVVDPAVKARAPSGPDYSRYATIGFLLGAVIAAAVIIILNFTDTRIHNEEYLTETYGIPVIAEIPDLFRSPDDQKYQKYSYYYKKSEEGKE